VRSRLANVVNSFLEATTTDLLALRAVGSAMSRPSRAAGGSRGTWCRRDAAHKVRPTGAKGLNLAINDVRILHECLVNALGQGSGLDALDAYGPRALDRIWKSENFSYWMTQMLHTPVEGVSFGLKRQIGKLNAVVSPTAGQTYLAESYTGWPAQELASS
jgi:2-polyprenyl-6-methoxyphenol hydroxylase-like FAD-dependent oxidoreductase